MSSITFSVVLPLYKQRDQLPSIVEEYVRALASQPESWELILVINGPDDGSHDLAVTLAAAQTNVVVLRLPQGGWGRAVKCGMNAARGQFCCYTNSARTQIPDLLLMLRYACVNRSTVIKASRIVRDSFVRKFGSVLYNFENRFLFQTAVMDVNGTPKILPREIWSSLEVFSDDDLIDAEVIAKCFQRNIPVVEVPVRLTARRSGKSTTRLGSAFRMYVGLVKLKRRL